MIETFKNAWKVPELRRNVLYTFFIIIIFRIGSAIPVPFLDPNALATFITSNSGNLLGYLDVMTGGGLSQATLFAMSITPYINASIILNLLTVALKPLENLAKQGEAGQKKIAAITRIVTVVLGLIQAFGYYIALKNSGAVLYGGAFAAIVIIGTFTAGTALIMWLGENINEKGIGNGISVILFAGIISRGPSLVNSLIMAMKNGNLNIFTLLLVIVGMLAVVAFIVFFTNAERRIPVQYAKRVVGRKMYGGQSTHIPLKVNMTGVLPIIFAMSIVSLPSTIAAFFSSPEPGTFWYSFLNAFSYTSVLYAVVYFILIIFFNYFYVSIQYNPIEIANNMKKNGGFIPGIRPGRPTADYISKSLGKITMIGSLFLGLIATLPIIISKFMAFNISIGGTSLLIVVGVALEVAQQLESKMLTRHYKGFLG